MRMADAPAEESRPADERELLTVDELNDRISATVGGASRLEDVVCRGEVSDLTERDTAVYIDLSDDAESQMIECVVFRSQYEEMDLAIEKGSEVVMSGDVNYWGVRGKLQFRPESITHVGEGAIQARIEQVRDELAERGCFDEGRTRQIPRYPERVGIVTSSDGDARHDMQTEIHARNPGIDLVLYSARVQGDDAPEEIAEGIDALGNADDIDALIVGRGGGSDRDLMAFNSKEVGEALFRADTPTISAVGHRADTTIACDVADLAAKTPTAAGSQFRDTDVLLERLDEHERKVRASYTPLKMIDGYERRTENAYTELVQRRLDDLETRLDRAYQQNEYEAAVEDAESTVPAVYKAVIIVLVVLVVALLILTLL